MGTITDLDGGTGGASSYNDLNNKPVTTITQTLTVGDNVINHKYNIVDRRGGDHNKKEKTRENLLSYLRQIT